MSRPVFLDVDPTLIESNLRIAEDKAEGELEKLFAKPKEEYPSKLVKPAPGFCIKTRQVGTETKLFVNICQTDAIPPPEDISEERLVAMLSNMDDETSSFRIPMSIGELRIESDKKGEEAKAIDVAINSSFFQKIENSSLFKNFLLTVVFEGLQDKHGVHTTDDRVLLKNKKAYGSLQLHRIQDREVAKKMGLTDSVESKQSAVEELTGLRDVKPKIETLSSVSYGDDQVKEVKYRLFKRKAAPDILVGEFKLPDVLTAKDITLDIGEDRIVLESKAKGYFLDIFVPQNINQDCVSSTFSRDSKILTVQMPIKVE